MKRESATVNLGNTNDSRAILYDHVIIKMKKRYLLVAAMYLVRFIDTFVKNIYHVIKTRQNRVTVIIHFISNAKFIL